MLNSLLTSVFGSRNERLLKQLNGIVKKINALEPQVQGLSDEALKAKTEEFRGRVGKGESLDKLAMETHLKAIGAMEGAARQRGEVA